MRKLIETKQNHAIVCDNTDCKYEIPYSEEEEKNIYKYINRSCPECGENLLTYEDYVQNEKILKTINWINKYFSWITFFYSKKSWEKRETYSLHVHDGIKISKEK